MKKKLTLGISSCPNDTFMFYALLHNKVAHPFDLEVTIRDVEELNQLVLRQELDVSKVSYHLAGLVQSDYQILDSGSALGWGCGPLVVTRKDSNFEELRGKKVAIPGEYTTANLLLKLYEPNINETVPILFSEIPKKVQMGEFDAGLIIHETRFTYEDLGLRLLVDLGKWWEDSTHLPIPLGGIVLKNHFQPEIKSTFEKALRQSILYAWDNVDEVMPFMKKWARELDDEVILNHVRLYVNDYSLSLGTDGRKAVEFLFSLGIEKGIFSERN